MSAEAAAAWYGATVATIVLFWDIYKWAGLSYGKAIKQYFSKTLPLDDAAQRFYQVARHHRRLWAVAADGTDGVRSDGEVLMYCAHAMKLANMRWSGIHTPSRLREDISHAQIENCQFINGLEAIMTSDGRHVFSSVRISKNDLNRLIKRIEAGESLRETGDLTNTPPGKD